MIAETEHSAGLDGVDLDRLRRTMLITRFADVTIGAVSLIVLSPLMILVAVAVALSDGPPVLYRQLRIGRHESAFSVIKFRTMRGSTGEKVDFADDNRRLTPLGRMLRGSSLDETPQLFNVLRGTMSLVGPRPLLPQYEPYYTERERLRFLVRPGLTGLAQVEGRRDIGWDRKLGLDADFVERYSVAEYFRILARTPRALLTTTRGATAVNELPLDVARRRN